jgi:hypothetical protein
LIIVTEIRCFRAAKSSIENRRKRLSIILERRCQASQNTPRRGGQIRRLRPAIGVILIVADNVGIDFGLEY